jgi:ATP-dependent Zn protease
LSIESLSAAASQLTIAAIKTTDEVNAAAEGTTKDLAGSLDPDRLFTRREPAAPPRNMPAGELPTVALAVTHMATGAGSAAMPTSVTVMGSLELAVYRKAWAGGRRYHLHERAMAARREHVAAARAAREQAVKAAEASLRAAGKPVDRREIEERLGALDALAESELDDDSAPSWRGKTEAPTPGRTAVRLLFARLFDQRPDLTDEMTNGAPIVIVDVPDPEAMVRLRGNWTDVILKDVRIAHGKKLDAEVKREDFGAVAHVTLEPIKGKDVENSERLGLAAVQLALPVIAISPAAQTHLPKSLRDAATAQLTLPPLDAATIARVIRVVTSKPSRELLPHDVVREIGLHELVLAVRFDKSPEQCMARLRELAARKIHKKDARDLTLDELHGMDEAVAWAKSTIRDLEDWKSGKIPWAAVDAAVCLNGPAGTGKSTFALVFSQAAGGLPLVTGSLSKWQSADEAHLGHLLRAMRRDFEEARAKAPCVMFIDEIDSFPIRNEVRHAHKDYVVEVVNGLLEQLDSLAGRDGVIFIGASNDVYRCDPAILRSGRLNRVIHIGMPGPADLEKMFRVRLRGDLADTDLTEVALLALGSTGADVERLVKDARRFARHEERSLVLDDLLRAIMGPRDRPPHLLRRSAAHEAGHLVADVLHFGPEDVYAVLRDQTDSSGAVWRMRGHRGAGTEEELSKMLQVLLAGRAAEQLLFGAPGQGSAGARNSDLAGATRIAAAMVGSLGYAGPHALVYLAPMREPEPVLNTGYMRLAVHRLLAKKYGAATALLSRHRAALEQITERLLEVRRVDGFEAQSIIETCGPTEAEDPAMLAAGPGEAAAAESPFDAADNAVTAALAAGFADPIDEPDADNRTFEFARRAPPTSGAE